MTRSKVSKKFGGVLLMLVLSLAGASRAETTIPVTDANVQAGLSPYNWISKGDAICSSICGASLTVGFCHPSMPF